MIQAIDIFGAVICSAGIIMTIVWAVLYVKENMEKTK